MNEDIIRKIANQASDYAENSEFNKGEELTPELLKVRDLKFAELIVRECADLCMQEGEKKYNNAWEQVRAKCDAQMILEHFGVE